MAQGIGDTLAPGPETKHLNPRPMNGSDLQTSGSNREGRNQMEAPIVISTRAATAIGGAASSPRVPLSAPSSPLEGQVVFKTRDISLTTVSSQSVGVPSKNLGPPAGNSFVIANSPGCSAEANPGTPKCM